MAITLFNNIENLKAKIQKMYALKNGNELEGS